ncbi:zinc finger BED domain-containing protein 4-like [Pelobates fuscus]|uniref:zinc finger BED domain-containing protein 4-like n=1 Tax=Pelobates fuscus TaxID=191477 RepID=UPI002FE46434
MLELETNMPKEELDYELMELKEERRESCPLFYPASDPSAPVSSPSSQSPSLSAYELPQFMETLGASSSARSGSSGEIMIINPTTSLPISISQPSASVEASVAPVSTATNEKTPASSAAARRRIEANMLRRGKVWDHFKCLHEGRIAKCKLCGKEVSRGRVVGHFTSAGMNLHLKRHHKSIFLKDEAEKESNRAGNKSTGTVTDSAQFSPPSSSVTTTTARQNRGNVENIAYSRQRQGRQGRVHQPSLSNLVGFHFRDMSKQQSNKITHLIAQLIAVGGVSFSTIEGEPFKHLIQALVPQYVIPTRSNFSRIIIPSLYRSYVVIVKMELAKAVGQTIHFTTDLWSAPSIQYAFLSLTAHWWQPSVPGYGGSGVNPSLAACQAGSGSVGKQGYRSLLLHAEVMDEDHSSENILQAVRRMVANWLGEQEGINVHIGFMVNNGAHNMVKALQDGSFVDVRCSAHILHLVVKGAIPDGNTRVATILDRCRRIAGHFHRSVKDSQLLRHEQEKTGLPTHCLRQDVSTQWNSILDMLERILEQQMVIHSLSSDQYIGIESPLGREDWTIIGQLVAVLKPFRDVTDNLCHSTASLGQVIPMFTHLMNKMDALLENNELVAGDTLQSDVAAVVRRLKVLLKARLSERVANCPELMLASLCDPRIKGKLALQSNSLTYWKDRLIDRIRDLQRERGMLDEGDMKIEPEVSDTPSCTNPEQQSGASAFWAEALGSLVGASEALSNQKESSASEMVRAYLYEHPLPHTADPLSYWDEKKSVWPALCLVAQQLLSCPPATVQNEQVFSVTGNILNPQGLQMSPQLMEQIAFLKYNLPKLGYPALQFNN